MVLRNLESLHVSAHESRLKAALADRYAVECEIGRGGMATVYLARDLRHERQVAVKVLRPELAAALGPERFLREIKIAANLNHPHIVSLHDSGEADGLLFYVMPYVEGESLRDRLNREKQLPIDDSLKIVSEVAYALGFAHDNNVIHRDIKPENILLKASHTLLADFGVARAIEEAEEERLTGTTMAIGTPAYLSPEQAGGERELDGRCDIYALGCVLYEMLAGEPPFTGSTVESIMRQHLTAEPPNVTVIRPSVPGRIAAALERSMAKTPADRFNTVAEFAAAITPGGDMTPTDVRPRRTAVMRSWKMKIGVAAAAVAIVGIGAALLPPRGSGRVLDPNRVLVVALADESGLEEFETLGRMAQEYIIQILTDAGFAEVVDPLTALAVSQSVAAAGMAAEPEDIRALADDARAGTVVSGSYYAHGDSVYIQTRITDASYGSLIGTVGPIVGFVGARSELVARLGREVVAALAPLLNQELGSWEPAQPAAYEAYEAYSEGLQAYQRFEWAEAGRHFERAVAADSTFTLARLWAAQSYMLLSGGDQLAESLLTPLVESRAELSRYERCRVDFVMALGPQPNLAAAYEAARCVFQASPGSDYARGELAGTAMRLNRPGEAIELLNGFHPPHGIMSQYWGMLDNAYHMLGDYEAALQAARQGRQWFPGEELEYLRLETRELAALGRLDDVATSLDAIRSLPSREDLGRSLAWVASVLRAHGHRTAARDVAGEAIAWFQSRPLDTQQLRTQLMWALYLAEQWDDTQRLARELAEEYPANTKYLATLGKLAARRDDRAEASRISDELQSSGDLELHPSHTLWRAEIAALLGNSGQAMTLLQEAIDQGVNWGQGPWLHADIDFESLRDYPPFQEFMRPKG